MKKTIALLLTLVLTAGLLAACAGQPVAAPAPGGAPSEPAPQPEAPPADTGEALKTGLSVRASLGSSKSAAAGEDGLAQADVTLVAVTVDGAGIIESCVIDGLQAKLGFDAGGRLTGDPAAEFLSKDELGEAYGMKKASGIGREWNEQAAAFAAYCVGKTVEELRGMAVTESGTAGEADLAASVTIHVGDFLAGVEAAVADASDLGARRGDTLKLVSSANAAKSRDAAADADGQVQVAADFAALTMRGGVITSCRIDAVQPTVAFDAAGAITSDLAAPPTKNELGEGYGLKQASGIGREWNEQAAAFAAYVTGKTVDEVTGIAVTETGAPAGADLAASVTIGIGGFQHLLAKAA